MDKYYYSYNEFLKDTKELHKKIEPFQADTFLAIARGGLTIAHLLSIASNIRDVFTINSIHYNKDKKLDDIKIFNIPNLSNSKRVLLIDDIADSGETLIATKRELISKYPDIELKVATLFYKESSLFKPDFYIKEAPSWIDFFWEIDPL